MITDKDLGELVEYMASGRMEEDFEYSAEDRKHEMLDFLEQVMDAGDLANEVATKLIFKNSQLGAMMGDMAQNQRRPDGEG
ncbi:MAG: hypothetical protein EOM25_07140 [Deltaproteobacteria bacterium]|nr:hypothetical protein [Deltaproteobacteria bacterium]